MSDVADIVSFEVTEQPATIERVKAVVGTTRSSGKWDLRDRLDAALGSQRTQVQG